MAYVLAHYICCMKRAIRNKSQKHYQLFKRLYFELALAKMNFVIPVPFSYFCLEKPQHAVREKSKGKISIQQQYSRTLTCFWFFVWLVGFFPRQFSIEFLIICIVWSYWFVRYQNKSLEQESSSVQSGDLCISASLLLLARKGLAGLWEEVVEVAKRSKKSGI